MNDNIFQKTYDIVYNLLKIEYKIDTVYVNSDDWTIAYFEFRYNNQNIVLCITTTFSDSASFPNNHPDVQIEGDINMQKFFELSYENDCFSDDSKLNVREHFNKHLDLFLSTTDIKKTYIDNLIKINQHEFILDEKYSSYNVPTRIINNTKYVVYHGEIAPQMNEVSCGGIFIYDDNESLLHIIRRHNFRILANTKVNVDYSFSYIKNEFKEMKIIINSCIE
jgi:hypothetical protein